MPHNKKVSGLNLGGGGFSCSSSSCWHVSRTEDMCDQLNFSIIVVWWIGNQWNRLQPSDNPVPEKLVWLSYHWFFSPPMHLIQNAGSNFPPLQQSIYTYRQCGSFSLDFTILHCYFYRSDHKTVKHWLFRGLFEVLQATLFFSYTLGKWGFVCNLQLGCCWVFLNSVAFT